MRHLSWSLQLSSPLVFLLQVFADDRASGVTAIQPPTTLIIKRPPGNCSAYHNNLLP